MSFFKCCLQLINSQNEQKLEATKKDKSSEGSNPSIAIGLSQGCSQGDKASQATKGSGINENHSKSTQQIKTYTACIVSIEGENEEFKRNQERPEREEKKLSIIKENSGKKEQRASDLKPIKGNCLRVPESYNEHQYSRGNNSPKNSQGSFNGSFHESKESLIVFQDHSFKSFGDDVYLGIPDSDAHLSPSLPSFQSSQKHISGSGSIQLNEISKSSKKSSGKYIIRNSKGEVSFG